LAVEAFSLLSDQHGEVRKGAAIGQSSDTVECPFLARFLPITDHRRGNPLAPLSTFESGCINEDLLDFLTRQSKRDISYSVATAGQKAPLFLKNPFPLNSMTVFSRILAADISCRRCSH
jgi:hypothetical protein